MKLKVTCAISLKIFVARSLLSSRGIRARIGLVGLQGVKILQLLVAGLFGHFPLDLRFLLLLPPVVVVVGAAAERWCLRNGFCVGHHAHAALEYVWLPRGTYGA